MTQTGFIVHGTPKPKGSLRHVGNGRLIEQVKGSDEWRQRIAVAARTVMAGRPPLTGPLQVDATVMLVRPKSTRHAFPITRSSGDADKHGRNLLDAMTGIVYVDDSQVIDLHISKRYVDVQLGSYARIEIRQVGSE